VWRAIRLGSGVEPALAGSPRRSRASPEDTQRYFFELNEKLVAKSDEFYSYEKPTDFHLERLPIRLYATGSQAKPEDELRFANKTGLFLRFTSPVESLYRKTTR